ncbi:hypothetical protein C0J52_06999 [Blattella germanica]|nr:hypothetical protein C0J52_06999 [Blattella germanica]
MANKKGINVYEFLLSIEDWHKIISTKLKTSKFKILRTSIGPLSEEQLGFMGDHLKLNATVHLHEEKKKLDLQFFAKSLPQKNQTFYKYVEEIGAFVKETGFFSKILLDLNKYVIKDEADGVDGFSWTCECYFTRPDIVVLEDLTVSGFKQTVYRKPLDYNHCVLMLKTLAHFHASTIIYEEKEPKTSNVGKACSLLDKYKDIFFETEWVTTEGHPGNKFLKSSVKGMEAIVEYLPNFGRNHENFKLIHEKAPEVSKMMCEVVKPSAKFRNVVCQGDLTTNNLFFRYGDDAETPIEAKIIDFQILRYNPPASEVCWFLHLVTRRDFREKHLEEFLSIYYECFSSILKRHKLDPEQLLPWSEFKESYEVYKNAGRLASAMYFQQSMMAGDYTAKVFSDPHHMAMFNTIDKSKYMIECYQDDPVFRERNTEAIEEFIENCVLKDWKF